MRLVAGFTLRRPGFDLRSVNVGFMVYKPALRQDFYYYFGFPYELLFHRLLYTYLAYLTYLSSGARTIVQIVADVRSELSLIEP
jgi:hypothetical protein